MMIAITGGTIYTPRRIAHDGVVLVEGDRILAVGNASQVPVPDNADRVDATGALVCPGLIDIHVHGGDGADCTEDTPEAIRIVARRHLRVGTTSLMATTASAPLPDIWRAFDAIGHVMRDPRSDEAAVLGIHMEGPFFSLAQRGSHNPDLLRMPDAAERERLYGYAGDLACVTLAPERENALEMIAQLTRRGVLVAGGHSDALYEQVCLAMDAGLRHVVHLWSGMSTVRRIGPKRHSGMLEAALVESGITGEIIADGYHLPSSLMKMAYRMKGPEKLCLISDAMSASGLGPGEYVVAGTRALVEEGGGVAIVPDRTAFAGSISTVLQCLQHVVHTVGFPLGEALEMATLTPARIHGIEDRVGRLAAGCEADLLLLDPTTLDPTAIMCRGNWMMPLSSCGAA